MAGSDLFRRHLQLLDLPVSEMTGDQLDAFDRLSSGVERANGASLAGGSTVLKSVDSPYGRLSLTTVPKPVPLSHYLVPSLIVPDRLDQLLLRPPNRSVEVDLRWKPEGEGVAYEALVNRVVPLPGDRGELLAREMPALAQSMGLAENDIVAVVQQMKREGAMESALALAKQGFGPVAEDYQIARVVAGGSLQPELLNPPDEEYGARLWSLLNDGAI